MIKRCLICGRFFIPDPRVGERQKACRKDSCKRARKRLAQRLWCEKNPGYFEGHYHRYVKGWRQRRRNGVVSSKEVIKDKIPLSKSFLKLILLIPEHRMEVIKDEIILRRLSQRTFVADG